MRSPYWVQETTRNLIEALPYQPCNCRPEAEFKEFEPWLKFKHRLKYGWFPKIVFNFSRFEPALN